METYPKIYDKRVVNTIEGLNRHKMKFSTRTIPNHTNDKWQNKCTYF